MPGGALRIPKKISWHHTLHKSRGRTHCNAVDGDVIGARVVPIKDNAATCRSCMHHAGDCWISLKLFDVLCEDVDIGNHVLNERMLVGAHLVSGEEEGL